MSELSILQEFLASGADVAIIVFLYFLWKIDRRLLVVEMQIKTLCVPKEDDE